MIDKFIQLIANKITSLISPSTLLKYFLIILIVSLFLSVFVGYGIIIITLAMIQFVWLTTEYLYSKQIEDEESEE